MARRKTPGKHLNKASSKARSLPPDNIKPLLIESLVVLGLIVSKSTTTHLAGSTRSFGYFIIDFLSVQLVLNNWYPFASQFAPAPLSKQTPEELMVVLKRNQLILVELCICMKNNAMSLFVDQGIMRWSFPTLKQVVSMAATFKNKCKKGIVGSWEGYQENPVSECFYFLFNGINIQMHLTEF
jgi:hypothetical protein